MFQNLSDTWGFFFSFFFFLKMQINLLLDVACKTILFQVQGKSEFTHQPDAFSGHEKKIYNHLLNVGEI